MFSFALLATDTPTLSPLAPP